MRILLSSVVSLFKITRFYIAQNATFLSLTVDPNEATALSGGCGKEKAGLAISAVIGGAFCLSTGALLAKLFL